MTYKFRTRDIATIIRQHRTERQEAQEGSKVQSQRLLSLCRYILSWKFINDGRPKKEVK